MKKDLFTEANDKKTYCMHPKYSFSEILKRFFRSVGSFETKEIFTDGAEMLFK